MPLIRPPSELSYGFEPHGLFSPVRGSCGECMDDVGAGRGVPGVVQLVGTGGGVYRVLPSRSVFEAYLMNLV